MSLQSWREEFCPTHASDMTTVHPIVQAQHALRKWTGALPHNLAKHGMMPRPGFDECGIVEVAEPHSYRGFEFGTRECIWCRLYKMDRGDITQCENCPLFDLRSAKCYNGMPDVFSPYKVWTHQKNPIPMIICIQQILRQEINKEMSKREIIAIRPPYMMNFTKLDSEWVSLAVLAYPTEWDRDNCRTDFSRTLFDLLSAGF